MILGAAQLLALMLILARIAGVFIAAPLFSSRSFSTPAKVAFAVWLSIVLWFVTPIAPNLPSTALPMMLVMTSEVAIGYIIGFICNIMFLAVQSAGEMIDLQMGLSVAQALDPVFGAVVSIIGRLAFYVALITFIVLDGHHMLLAALHQSFTALPAGQIANFASPGLAQQMIGLGSALWLASLKLAVPVILLIFLADFTFGIVSRVAPQVNVFMLGFQVKPLLGLFGLLLISPFLVKYVNTMIGGFGEQIVRLLLFIK